MIRISAIKRFKFFFNRLFLILRVFQKNTKGATAIEFAILVPIFFFMIFAIFDTCFSSLALQTMTNASDMVARKIKVGEMKNVDKQTLHNVICKELIFSIPLGCPDLKIDLKTYKDLAKLNIEAERRLKNSPDPSTFTVSSVAPRDFVIISLYYPWSPIVDFLNLININQKNKKATAHFAQTVWKNEPY